MKSFPVQVAPEVRLAFADQTRSGANNKPRFVTYKLNDRFNEIQVDQIGSPTATHSDFLAALPQTECRFATIRLNYDQGADGLREKNLLVLWAPLDAPVKARMLSASFKGTLKYELGSTSPINIDSGCKADLALDELLNRCRKTARSSEA